MTTERILALIFAFISAGGLAAVSALGQPVWVVVLTGIAAGSSAAAGWLGFSKPSDKAKLKSPILPLLVLGLALGLGGCSATCRLASRGIEAAAIAGSAPQCDEECKAKALKAVDGFEWLGEKVCK